MKEREKGKKTLVEAERGRNSCVSKTKFFKNQLLKKKSPKKEKSLTAFAKEEFKENTDPRYQYTKFTVVK